MSDLSELQLFGFTFEGFTFWLQIQEKYDSSGEALCKCLQSEVVYERRGFPAGIKQTFFVVCASCGFIFFLLLASLVKVMTMKSPFIGQ